MIRLSHTGRLQHGNPVLEAQQIPLTNFRGTEPIVVAMVSIHHGISKPIRFGLPAICFWLVAGLSRSLSTPFNSCSDRGYRLSHGFGPSECKSFVLRRWSKLGAMRGIDGEAGRTAFDKWVDSYVNITGCVCESCSSG